MTRARRILLGAVGLFALVVGLNALYGLTVDPMEAVYAQAERLGHPREDLRVVSGGYEQGWFAWEAHGVFREASADGESGLRVVVERPSPLHPWRLHTAQSGPDVGR